jgi:hypothetical protein
MLSRERGKRGGDIFLLFFVSSIIRLTDIDLFMEKLSCDPCGG